MTAVASHELCAGHILVLDSTRRKLQHLGRGTSFLSDTTFKTDSSSWIFSSCCFWKEGLNFLLQANSYLHTSYNIIQIQPVLVLLEFHTICKNNYICVIFMCHFPYNSPLSLLCVLFVQLWFLADVKTLFGHIISVTLTLHSITPCALKPIYD